MALSKQLNHLNILMLGFISYRPNLLLQHSIHSTSCKIIRCKDNYNDSLLWLLHNIKQT